MNRKKLFSCPKESPQIFTVKFRKVNFQNYISYVTVLFLIFCLQFQSDSLAQQKKDLIKNDVKIKIQVLNVEDINNRINTISDLKTIDEQTKNKIIELYRQALASLNKAEEFKTEKSTYESLLKTAPSQINQIQTQEQQLETIFPSVKFLNSMAFEQIEANLSQQQLQLNTTRSTLQELEAQIAKVESRPGTIQKLKEENRIKLTQIEQELNTPPAVDEKAELTEAKQLALLVRQQMRQAELNTLDQELISHNARLNLHTAQKNLAQRQIKHHEKLVKFWEDELNKRQQEDALQEIKAAHSALQKSSDLPEDLQILAKENLNLAKSINQIAVKNNKYKNQLEQDKLLNEEIKRSFDSLKQRINAVGLNEAIGLLLRKQRQVMPNLSDHRRIIASLEKELSKIAIAKIDLEEIRLNLMDFETKLINKIQIVQQTHPWDKTNGQLVVKTDNLLKNHRELIDKLLITYRNYAKSLDAHEALERELISITREFNAFIERNILWIKSAGFFGTSDIKETIKAILWFVRPTQWKQVFVDLRTSMRKKSGLWILSFLIFVGLFFIYKWAKDNFTKCSISAKKSPNESFLCSLRSISLILLISTMYPLFWGYILWKLNASIELTNFTSTLCVGLVYAIILWGILSFFYNLCQSDNVIHSHFNWPANVLASIRKNLFLLRPIITGAGFIIGFMEASNIENFRISIARIIFIICAFFFTLFFLQIHKPIFQYLKRKKAQSWLFRFRYIWRYFAAGMPIIMIFFAVFGYYDTALYLGIRFLLSVLFISSMLIIYALLLHWLFVAHKRLVNEETERKKKLAQSQQAEIKSTSDFPISESISPAKSEINLAQVNTQTKTILQIIMGFALVTVLLIIWADIFPALYFLENIKLGWSYTSVIDGIETQVPVVLSDLLLAILIFILTIIATKNLPGFLEIAILSHFDMEMGSRYAITTICRYAIMIVGVVISVNAIGGSWSQIQWLVAALGVGLGFGLQEIFANFISGIIILFERPIRIGDTVTIGDITGNVSSIRIRATTITDWDRRELIVPNKEFITGQLINWSLSDQVIRIKVPVGVIYGSDTALVEKLLLEIADKNPQVLEDPAPTALFLGFGDNSLNFELRAFVSGITKFLLVTHQLHRAIDDEFRKHNLVIAFPQRDVHLDAQKPIKIEVVNNNFK